MYTYLFANLNKLYLSVVLNSRGTRGSERQMPPALLLIGGNSYSSFATPSRGVLSQLLTMYSQDSRQGHIREKVDTNRRDGRGRASDTRENPSVLWQALRMGDFPCVGGDS